MEGFSFGSFLIFFLKLLCFKLILMGFSFIRKKIFKNKDETLEKNKEENDNNNSSNPK